MKDLVSVIIPTYKRPDTLSRAINSVLNQTYQNVEIIVVDDNNPDTGYREKTESVMIQFESIPKVIYLKHAHNKNGSAARNTGIRASKGKYIAFLDDDDEFLPNKIAIQVAKMTSLDMTWGACYTKYIVKDGDAIIAKTGETKEGNLLTDALMRNLMIAAGSNLFVRRSVVEELNGFDESFVRNQDLEFMARMLSKYKMACCKECALVIHAHIDKNFHVDFEAVTERFMETFKSFHESLPLKDQIRTKKMINLQLFRYRLIKKKDVKACVSMILSGEVSFVNAIRYMFHLAYRAIFKVRKGFNL